jgi:hypothetical protein
MTSARQMFVKAGPVVGLPFLLLVGLLLQSSASLLAKEEPILTFQEFESTCIDLGHYDEKAQQLTVRFVNRNTERFYRYSNVPTEVWKKLKTMNETGGVGEYPERDGRAASGEVSVQGTKNSFLQNDS